MMTEFVVVILLTTVAFALCSCDRHRRQDNPDVYPKDSFSVLTYTQDGMPHIGSINMSYKDYSRKSEYPWHLYIAIGLDTAQCDSFGLASESENLVANEMEDALLLGLRKVSAIHYVGHMFNNTFLDVHIYLDDAPAVNEYLQKLIKNDRNIRGFAFKMTLDPKWDDVERVFSWGE